MFDIEPEDMLNDFIHPKSRLIPLTQEEKLDENADELLDSLLEREASLIDEERISPDTFGCECVFLDGFVTEDMSADFSLIARDFLLHGYYGAAEPPFRCGVSRLSGTG